MFRHTAWKTLYFREYLCSTAWVGRSRGFCFCHDFVDSRPFNSADISRSLLYCDHCLPASVGPLKWPLHTHTQVRLENSARGQCRRMTSLASGGFDGPGFPRHLRHLCRGVCSGQTVCNRSFAEFSGTSLPPWSWHQCRELSPSPNFLLAECEALKNLPTG